MDTGSFERLVAVMARIVEGDEAAIFTLFLDFGGHVAALLRRHLAKMGVDHIEEDDLHGLVVDACFAIADVAGGWDAAGGALPWNWAARRIQPIATAWVGQYATNIDFVQDELDAGEFLHPAHHVAPDANDLVLLDELAACHDRCALVYEALARVASERDRTILLELRIQSQAGDLAPAVTIADRHGLSPAAVRQVACRVRSRLRKLAAADDRFAPLADLALVA